MLMDTITTKCQSIAHLQNIKGIRKWRNRFFYNCSHSERRSPNPVDAHSEISAFSSDETLKFVCVATKS